MIALKDTEFVKGLKTSPITPRGSTKFCGMIFFLIDRWFNCTSSGVGSMFIPTPALIDKFCSFASTFAFAFCPIKPSIFNRFFSLFFMCVVEPWIICLLVRCFIFLGWTRWLSLSFLLFEQTNLDFCCMVTSHEGAILVWSEYQVYSVWTNTQKRNFLNNYNK